MTDVASDAKDYRTSFAKYLRPKLSRQGSKSFVFLKCFEFTGMHTVVMKYFRYDMRCIDDRWNSYVSFK